MKETFTLYRKTKPMTTVVSTGTVAKHDEEQVLSAGVWNNVTTITSLSLAIAEHMLHVGMADGHYLAWTQNG